MRFAARIGVKADWRDRRSKFEQPVRLDRRKHDDDLAERITGGVRAVLVHRRAAGTPRREYNPHLTTTPNDEALASLTGRQDSTTNF